MSSVFADGEVGWSRFEGGERLGNRCWVVKLVCYPFGEMITERVGLFSRGFKMLLFLLVVIVSVSARA